MQPDQRKPGNTIARILAVSAAATVVLAIVLGATVATPLYAIALIALFDLGLAWAFQTGKLKPASDARLGRPEEGGVVAGDQAASPADPTADPSYNPYARED